MGYFQKSYVQQKLMRQKIRNNRREKKSSKCCLLIKSCVRLIAQATAQPKGKETIPAPKNCSPHPSLKAGFHQRPIYKLMKIKNWTPKRSHKLDGIGVGRIRTFPFLSIPFTTVSLMIQCKLDCRSTCSKQKRKK